MNLCWIHCDQNFFKTMKKFSFTTFSTLPNLSFRESVICIPFSFFFHIYYFSHFFLFNFSHVYSICVPVLNIAHSFSLRFKSDFVLLFFHFFWLIGEHFSCLPSLYHLLFSVQFSGSVVSDSLRPHESQHPRPPCPSPTLGIHSDSCPSSRWCHPAISSSVAPFPPAPSPSQHQGLFQWVNSLHEVAKVLEFQLQHQSFQWTPRTDLF